APFAIAAGAGDTTAAAWLPALNTQFGRWLLLRLGLLAIVLALSLARRGSGVALLLAAAALALQPQLAHAGAIGGRLGLLLCGSEALHMLAAGAWLGGLLPLVLALATLPAEPAARVCRRFSRLAASAVIILAVTGSLQGRVLIGTEAALFHSAYGHVALVKLALVVCAIGLGAVSRFVLLPLVPAAATAGRRMQLAVAVETVFGLAVVLAAAWLASLGPAAEMDPGALDWRPGLPSLTAIVALALVAFALLRRPA
ncbi:MAG TPA: CopD family protein, partial [Acetobacteraceae bacterium]|nr:CopD family protein [Acetobacteraceae bacterium]